jgi:uncharacterized protein (TIGR02246 family)
MKQLTAVVLLVWSVAAQAQAPGLGVGKGIETAHRNLRAEAEIRQRYEEFTAAFNRHDTGAMAAMWTVHGDHYEPDGSFAEGREAVAKLFAEEHDGAFKNAAIDLTIDTVWMITPNVALVNGFYRVTGVRDLAGNEIAIRKGHLTSVLLGENGQWWVAASRAAVPLPVPWRKPPEAAPR